MTQHNEFRLPDGPLRVICSCGHSTFYDDLSDFTTDGGNITYQRSVDLYAAVCPSCETPRPVKVGTFELDDIECEIYLALGEFENGYTPLQDSIHEEYDLSRTNFSSVANPVYIARQRFDPICIRCGEHLTSEDKRSDGEAPEVGWKYYKCPSCGHKMHPESVGNLG